MSVFSLENKTILITGASSGIGQALAVICSQQGAKLVITGRSSDKLNKTLNLLAGEGHIKIVADLICYEDIEKLAEQSPYLDGFVSNAGIAQLLLLKLADREDVESTLNVNSIAAIQLTRLLLQNKKLKKNASIVFTSSINGNKCAYIGSSIYAASKSMLTGFSKALALELAPQNIRVNTVEPGMIETDLIQESAISQEEIEKDKLKYPLKRYGRPEEVAYAIVYLLSDATQWMTGSQLLIDGGYTLQ